MAQAVKVVAQEVAVQGEEITLALKVLFRDVLNVRKKGTSVVVLAALILAQGVLQNLVVRAERGARKRRTGRYGVVAGGRRLAALLLLLAEGKITEDYPVRCLLVSDDQAVAMSLAENSGREPLHGADQFEAFQALINEGRSVEQVAGTWGVSALTVRRWLKLANVSPRLLALYRDEGIELDQLMALALTDDHALQEQVWDGCSEHARSPYILRSRIANRGVVQSDPVALFVGLDAYERAGGEVLRDLFSDDEQAATLADQPLLERLAREALQVDAEVVRAEGWPWVDVVLDYSELRASCLRPARRVVRALTPEEAAEREALVARVAEIEEKQEATEGGGDYYELENALADASEALQAFDERVRSIAPDQRAVAGAVVLVGDRGVVEVRRGLLRGGEGAAAVVREASADGDDDECRAAAPATRQVPAKPEFSERLQRQLTAHRSAGLRAKLAGSPMVALRFMAYSMARPLVYERGYDGDDVVGVRYTVPYLESDAPDLQDSLAYNEYQAQRQRWLERLPADDAALLEWSLGCDEQEVVAFIGFCVAGTVNCVQSRDRARPVADRLAQVLGLDMADWWTPTRESYLGSVPKAKILAAISDAVSPQASARLAGMKREALIDAAERELAGKRWLPQPLRAPGTVD